MRQQQQLMQQQLRQQQQQQRKVQRGAVQVRNGGPFVIQVGSKL